MNIDNQISVIEITADYLCLIILGDKKSIDDLSMKLNVDKKNNTEYISVKIDCPSATKCNELIKNLNGITDIDNFDINKIKNVIIDDGVETAQCYTYAEGYNSQSYMLMSIIENDNEYILGYPKFELNDEEDPELIVEDWFKKKIKKLPSGFRKNMKLITVVGINTNILVLATKISNKK